MMMKTMWTQIGRVREDALPDSRSKVAVDRVDAMAACWPGFPRAPLGEEQYDSTG